MPLFIDLHNDMQGVSRENVCNAHLADVEIQDKYGVKYHKFWVNEEKGFVFCLIEGPSKEACEKVHRMSHGHVACEIIEVTPSDLALFMGPGQTDPIGQVIHPDGKFDSAVRTILFTDIVGSTEFTHQHGDSKALEILRKHNKIVRAAIGKYTGSEVKHTGDGIMASFASVAKGVSAAIEIQKELAIYRNSPHVVPFNVRVGVNTGEPVTEGNDLFGIAVQMAARLTDLAEPDQILVSGVVKSLCMGKDFKFLDVGKVPLKGIEDPVDVSEVIWNDQTASATNS